MTRAAPAPHRPPVWSWVFPLAGLALLAGERLGLLAAGADGVAALAAVLVGPWTATLCMTVVLTVQALDESRTVPPGQVHGPQDRRTGRRVGDIDDRSSVMTVRLRRERGRGHGGEPPSVHQEVPERPEERSQRSPPQ